MDTEWFYCPSCVAEIGEMYSREIAARDGFTCWACEGTLVAETTEA